MWVTLPSLLVSAVAKTCHCIQCQCPPIDGSYGSVEALAFVSMRGSARCWSVEGAASVFTEFSLSVFEKVAPSGMRSSWTGSADAGLPGADSGTQLEAAEVEAAAVGPGAEIDPVCYVLQAMHRSLGVPHWRCYIRRGN